MKQSTIDRIRNAAYNRTTVVIGKYTTRPISTPAMYSAARPMTSAASGLTTRAAASPRGKWLRTCKEGST